MRSLARSLASVALLLATASCHFDDLVDTPPTGVLVATPASVSVNAAAGPGSPRPVTLSLTSAAHTAVAWTITRTGEGNWLTLQESEGSTPDTLHLSISAAGLAAGTYKDTLVITPDDPDQATTRVPVTLVVAAGAERLSFRQAPTTAAAGAAITPAVTVAGVDRNGDVITTFQGTITLSLAGGPPGATLSGDVSASAVNGVATFTGLSLDKAGAGYALVASAAGMADETSATFAITPGAATRLAFTQQPTSTTPNAVITPAVQVTAYDGYGNVVTNFTGAVTITLGQDGSVLGNATLGGTRTRNAAAGVARFDDLSIDQLGGGYTLVASSSGLSSATSAGFDITPLSGSASEQRFSRQPSDAQAGTAISPAVEVTILDGLGAPVTTFTDPVTLALSGGPPGALLSGTTTAIPSNGVARFSNLTVDRAGTGYRLVAKTAGLPDVSSSAFDITAPPPSTGAITVVTHTTGADLDPDGYTVTVNGTSRTLPLEGSTTYTGLPAGDQVVGLTGLASNCTAAGGNPRAVAVAGGDTVTTTFDVTCAALPPSTGALTVATSTTGSDIDPDGYTVTVNGVDRSLAPNASTTFADLPAGSVTAALSGLANNCTVQGGNPRTVTITAGSTATTTFDVTCTTIGTSTGSLTVATNTTGSGTDPDGYTVTVAGDSRALPLNGSTTYTGLPAGAVTVTLSGVAGNCSIFGANPRSITVIGGSTVSTTFDVGCSTVTPPPAASQLRFLSQPPSVVVVGGNFVVSVAALDVNGNLVPTFTGRVNLVLSGALLGTSLAGTTGVNAVNGVATFTDLHVTGPCVGCRIQAGAAGLVTATSDAFTIVVP